MHGEGSLTGCCGCCECCGQDGTAFSVERSVFDAGRRREQGARSTEHGGLCIQGLGTRTWAPAAPSRPASTLGPWMHGWTEGGGAASGQRASGPAPSAGRVLETGLHPCHVGPGGGHVSPRLTSPHSSSQSAQSGQAMGPDGADAQTTLTRPQAARAVRPAQCREHRAGKRAQRHPLTHSLAHSLTHPLPIHRDAQAGSSSYSDARPQRSSTPTGSIADDAHELLALPQPAHPRPPLPSTLFSFSSAPSPSCSPAASPDVATTRLPCSPDRKSVV